MEYTNKYNLHTHSYYCGHGEGEIIEYIEKAKSMGLDILGFSEHLPFEGNKYFRSTRMSYESRKDYEKDVRDYSSKDIKILLGYECDYLEEDHSYFEKVKSEVDYLITGTHFLRKDGRTISPFSSLLDSSDMKQYQDKVISAINSGLFSFVAHPDLYLHSATWNEETAIIAENIISAAVKNDIPLEINGRGTNKIVNDEWAYPKKDFFKLAKAMNAKLIASTDSHTIREMDNNFLALASFIKELDIKLVSVSFQNKLIFK